MNILKMSLARAFRTDELEAHLRRLSHPHGWFKTLMDHHHTIGSQTLVLIAIRNAEPVGVMMVDILKRCGVFVDPMRRRDGIGSALMHEARAVAGPGLRVAWDDEGSHRFFKELEVPCGLILDENAPHSSEPEVLDWIKLQNEELRG